MNLIESNDNYAEFHFDADSSDQIALPDGEWEFLLFSRFVREDETQPRARAAVSVTDLIGLVVPGYDQVDDDTEAFMARYYSAREIAGEVQAVFNAQAVQQGVDITDPACDPLWFDKDQPCPLEAWDGPAPLVLVRTDYAPFTDRHCPTGAIVWIDPATERDFVESLDTAGFVQLSERLADD